MPGFQPFYNFFPFLLSQLATRSTRVNVNWIASAHRYFSDANGLNLVFMIFAHVPAHNVEPWESCVL